MGTTIQFISFFGMETVMIPLLKRWDNPLKTIGDLQAIITDKTTFSILPLIY